MLIVHIILQSEVEEGEEAMAEKIEKNALALPSSEYYFVVDLFPGREKEAIMGKWERCTRGRQMVRSKWLRDIF